MRWPVFTSLGRNWPLLAVFALLAAAAAVAMPVFRADHCEAQALLAGVTLAEERATHSLIVTSLRRGSAAADDGVMVGDRVDRVNGHPVNSLRQLGQALLPGVGKSVPVALHNANRHYQVTLTGDCHDPSNPRDRR